MEKRMKKSASVLLSSAILMFLSPALVAQQAETKAPAHTGAKPTHMVSDKGSMMRGSNDAAKKGTDVNVAGKEAPAPPSKTKGATRGERDCTVKVDNWKGYYIRVYMNGDYVGSVGPWSAGTIELSQGVAELEGYAVFDDGSALKFGPNSFRCSEGSYTWTLGK
jgi:hypothetical protein